MIFRAAVAGLLVTLLGITALLAQEVVATKKRPAADSPDSTGKNSEGEVVKRILDTLTKEEREQFRLAVNEVWHAEEVESLRQAMLEANLAYRRALQEEIRTLDASEKVRSVLLKLMQLRFRAGIRAADGVDSRPGARPAVGGAGRPRSEEERAIINAARTKAEKTPAVMVAKRNLDRAVTTRQRSVASARYRQAMLRAMEAPDPRVKRIFAPAERKAIDRPRAPDRR